MVSEMVFNFSLAGKPMPSPAYARKDQFLLSFIDQNYKILLVAQKN